MNTGEVLFFIGFFGVLCLAGYKFYNVISAGKVYDFRIAIMTFLGYFLAWLLCLMPVLGDPTNIMMFQLFKLTNWLMLLNVLFFIAELFFNLEVISKPSIKPFKATAHYENPLRR